MFDIESYSQPYETTCYIAMTLQSNGNRLCSGLTNNFFKEVSHFQFQIKFMSEIIVKYLFSNHGTIPENGLITPGAILATKGLRSIIK